MNVKTICAKNNNDQNYISVLSPLKIGEVTLSNRIVFPSWQVNYANNDGSVSDKLLHFYTGLADGGCGLIFTGCAVVSPDTVAFDRVMRIDKDTYIPALKNLFYEIEKRGSVPGIQLIHYGRQALKSVTGCDLLAPSPIPCPVMSTLEPNYTVREISIEDIERLRIDFIKAAVRAVEAGAKVIEIHAAHGYLLNQFLSPYSNHRTDNYGGTLNNRARFVVEIIKGVRSQIGEQAVISVRVSGNEFVSGGLTPPDFKNIIPLMEKAGMDLLNVTAGVYESMERIVPPEKLGETPHVNIASELKKFASVPVCTVGSIFSLETAESIISSGKADLVAMGRAQVADPEIVRKSASHKEAEIRKCIRCNKCAFWTTGDPQMHCSVNPSFKCEK
jgi:2,4-dienoyl-CoA reductase-like NADH-dependent reductase (Old Yellow Enzyme family)